MKHRSILGPLAMALLILLGVAAQEMAQPPGVGATPVTLHYVGCNFDLIYDPIYGPNLTGAITIDVPGNPATYVGDLDPATITWYSFKAGSAEWTQANSTLINRVNPTYSPMTLNTWYMRATNDTSKRMETADDDGDMVVFWNGDGWVGNACDSKGVWSLAPAVPVPGAALLFGSGLAGLAVVRRLRREIK